MSNDNVITISPPDERRIQIPIMSDSRLVMHNWSAKARRMMLDKQMGKTVKKKFKDPEEDFRESIYESQDGWFGMPCTAFKQALVRGASYVGDKAVNMLKTRGMLFVIPDGASEEGTDLVKIYGDGPYMREDMVRLNGKTADIRHRAEFRTWGALVTVRYNADIITDEQIVNLMALAGLHAGIGEGRPSAPKCSMDWGMFHVASAEEVDQLRVAA